MITCLGKEFNSDEERREYFRNELRKKLPELKKIEGFPIGEDDDIIELSDPPYYTACPNPWLNDFITEWELEKDNIPGRVNGFKVDEPYASNVSVGKNNPFYSAHSYHTKVPHPAIMRYILYYTQPGDIVFDGFAGTGMTGVAAHQCQNPNSELKYSIEKEFSKQNLKTPIWGRRKAICGDLSPFASYIDYCLNSKIDNNEFSSHVQNCLEQVEKELGWMFTTNHIDNTKRKVNYYVWSEVFLCSNCNNEIIYWDVAVDKINQKLKESFFCENCKTEHRKNDLDRAFETLFDESIGKTIKIAKTKIVLINYSVEKKRFEKKPDNADFALLDKIQQYKLNVFYPNYRMLDGDEARRNDDKGLTHTHHFYTKRNLAVISLLWNKLDLKYKFFLTSAIGRNLTKLNRYIFYKGKGGIGRPMSGTLYVSSEVVEQSPFHLLKNYNLGFNVLFNNLTYIGSASNLNIIDNSIDYIYTDPPFGANIMYSELNFISENWINLRTNNLDEAIQNKTQNKTLLEYQDIMTSCFKEYYRILKPNKWMTVEFSNTSAAVWNGIQVSLQRAGFVIANIASLDKKHGGIRAMFYATSVKQDLIITCYKPSNTFELIVKEENIDLSVWNFVTMHLKHLPIILNKDNKSTNIIERSPKILFDRLITFFLMRGMPIPIDAKDFHEGLMQRFVERDNMYFTAEQAVEYDEKKAKSPSFVQLSLIVSNESEAVEWLKDRLRKNAQKYQDIMPDFRISSQSVRKGDILPELRDILEQNFIQDKSGKWHVPDLNEIKDREKLRNKVLMKEFNNYITEINKPKAKKLKEVRVEALREGFKKCWEKKDFKTIVTLAEKIPQNILLEDEQLLMFYDIAKDRI